MPKARTSSAIARGITGTQRATPGRRPVFPTALVPQTPRLLGSQQAPVVYPRSSGALDRLRRAGVQITPGGPGRGPQASFIGGGNLVGHPTPASQFSAYEAALAGGPFEPATGGGGFGGGFGGDGGGGGAEELMALHDIKWKAGSWETPGGKAPSWWQALQPENSADAERPDVAFLMNLNSMIPYMSPEDQRRAAAQLYALNADAFSRYKSEFINVDTPVSGETAAISNQPGLNVIDEDYFTGSQRARDAIRALSNMREATVGGNRWKFGPGYTWLQQVLGAIEAYGGGALDGTGIAPGNTPIDLTRPNIGRRTRSQELALLGQLDPLLAQGESSDIGPFGAIGRMLSQPFFSQGVLSAATRGEGGQPIPGRRNRLLRY